MTRGVISSRVTDRGGSDPVKVYLKEAPGPADLWIVYVHGFNVSPDDAYNQLNSLRDRSDGRFVPGSGGVAWIAYLWPSELTRHSWFNKGTYPKVLERVIPAANRLGDYLSDSGVRRIVLVGNSLGAMVALQASKRMKERGRPADGLALLAAAVRTDVVDGDGAYGVPDTDHESVTVNPDDSVLRTVFGVGERLAQVFGGTPKAVGLTGDPSSRSWTRVRLYHTEHAAYRQDRVEQAVAAACAARLSEPVRRVVASRPIESTEPPGR